MADELLPYYEKELAFIRQMGAEFAKEHPKIAGRLGIHNDTIEDPHASRLIESFAYLNARIQHKLDDEFPELSDAILGVMFPHYQRPIPSMSVVQFVPDEDQLDGHFAISKDTLVETEQFQGENCRFATVYDADLWPVKIINASLIGRPFATPGTSQVRGAASVLKISLQTFNDAISLQEVAPKKLRLFLKGQPLYTYPLYQFLLNGCLDVFLATSEGDTNPVRLGSQAIKPVGFTKNEGLLPYPPNSAIGYRLLTEFFVFPEKFMFVDIDLQGRLPIDATNRLDFYFYFNTADIELEHNVSAESFALGCTPMVNLFSHKADPIKIDQTQMEYQVVPDARRPVGYEIYSVDRVTATTSSGETSDYLPFYGLTHKEQNDNRRAYWYCQRRPAKMGYYERDEGTDMYLSLVDLNFNPNQPFDRTLVINTTCSNRDLPSKLPFTLDHPRLQCVNGAPPCSRIRCLTQPSSTIRPPLKNRARWRLISHLNLNLLSISGQGNSTDAFKEILRLYDFKETSVTRGLIESVQSVQAKSISAPLNIDGRATICRGVEIEIELDENLLTGSSSYLFATVLEHFFALYCPINSFTRTLVRLKGKEGYLKKCPPRSGEKNSAVIEQLLQSPELVSFFQAVRLLERAATLHNRAPGGAAMNERSVGQFTPPGTEVARFSTHLTLGFPGSEIIRIQRENAGQGSRWHVTVSFMGLTGSTGVLPFHYTEILFQRLKLRDESLRDFLDMFNHRLVSLFFQAGMKYRLPLAYERQKLIQQRRERLDAHTHTILSLLGLGTDHLLDQLNIHHESLVFFAGLLSQRTRPANGLRQMLAYYFDVPVEVQEFIGEWHDLIEDVRTRLPYPGNPLGQNACLGRSAILGGKGWFAQGKIRVLIGPLDAEQFQRFAPGTTTLRRLNEIVKMYSGSELDAEYVLRVARRHIPHRIQLRQATPPTIGWDTWLASQTNDAAANEDTLDIRVSSARLN